MTSANFFTAFINSALRCPCGRMLQNSEPSIEDGHIQFACPRCKHELVDLRFPAGGELELDLAPRPLAEDDHDHH